MDFEYPNPLSPHPIPSKYQPLSPWAFFGLSILFSIPVVGFIFLIVFSFNDSNLCRRNFARSYWCALAVAAIAIAVIVLIYVILGVGLGAALMSSANY